MSIRIRFIPPLSAACAGGLLTLIVVAALLLPGAIASNERFVVSYGQTLADMAAKQSVDATFNHDLVRLQVILQDIVATPYTIMATIHDVENKLLVQAGNARDKQPTDMTTYTSPIVLHDSVAGYVSVKIDASPWSLHSAIALIIALGCFALALGIWSLFHRNAVEWSINTTEPTSDNSLSESQFGTDGEEYDEPSELEPKETVFAVIHIKNLDVLEQQLDGKSFRATFSRLEKIMSDVLALYGGQRFELVENYYVLRFYVGQERGDALFNAACSAFLILELAGIIDKIPLDLAALVSANESDITPRKLPIAGLIVEATAGEEELISRRIEFMDIGTEDGRRILSDFRQPFKNLLEKQRKQLFQIL